MLRLICLLWAFAVPAFASGPDWKFSLTLENPPKYGTDFAQFSYANPAAPKGGSAKIAAIGSFDSLNPFILKGNSATGLGNTLEPLMARSLDESSVQYPLLAKKLRHPEDFSWVEFYIDERAQFANGAKVTPDHVRQSFFLLRDEGVPFYRYYYKNVAEVAVTGAQTIRFEFDEANNRELPFIMSQLPVFYTDQFAGGGFAESSLEPIIATGPYEVTKVEAGRSVTMTRRNNYWGDVVPSMRGLNHIGTLNYEYFRDPAVAFEAFKSGAYDFHAETQAKRWATGYDFPRATNGEILRDEVVLQGVKPMQSFAFNIRKEKFNNNLVRQALSRMFDFAWLNENLFYGQYKRTKSFFEGSELASQGIPEGAELELLLPFKDELPEDLFTKPYVLPGEESPKYDRRRQLRKALGELKQAGWSLQNGKLVDANNNPFTLEFLINNADFERIVAPLTRAFQDLGIDASIRVVDAAQYEKREEDFDFDMISTNFAQSTSPGNEQRDFWSSDAAKRKGSRNLIGISSPVVDALIDKIIFAESREGLIAACRALDRVLLWGNYLIPNWYSPGSRIAYDAKFGHPEPLPSHDLGFPEAWWVKN